MRLEKYSIPRSAQRSHSGHFEGYHGKVRLKMASEKEDLNIYELLSTIGQTGYVPVQLISRFTKKTLTSGFSSNISMLFALFFGL